MKIIRFYMVYAGAQWVALKTGAPTIILIVGSSKMFQKLS